MEELLQKLQNLHGLTAEQSSGVLNTITSYIKEKFPMIGGAVDNFFPQSTATNTATTSTTVSDATQAAAAGTGDGSFLDKISDMIPGGAGEKIEEFAKDKLGGLFSKK